MTQKQKVLGGVMVLVVIALFVLLYSYLFQQDSGEIIRSEDTSEQRINEKVGGISSNKVAVPATPDATVDAIIDDASLDEQSLQKDATDEQDAIKASGTDITNLSQTYDENQL